MVVVTYAVETELLATVTVVGTTVAVGVTVKVVVWPDCSALTLTTFLVCFLMASSIACLIGSATAVSRIAKRQGMQVSAVLPGRHGVARLTGRKDLLVGELLDSIGSTILQVLLGSLYFWDILNGLDRRSPPVTTSIVVGAGRT